MTASNQIRPTIAIAILVVVATMALLLTLSVFGQGDGQAGDRPPATGAPIVFPTNDGTR